MSLATRQQDALEPVRAALRLQADARAGAIVRQAREEAAALLTQARSEAARAVAEAAADGRAQAGRIAAARLGLARRSAREQLLGSDLGTYDYLAGRITDAVLALRSEPGYPRLRARLAEAAARAAGPGAVVTEPQEGGAVATAPGVVVDCSLSRMAERAISALGAAMAGLCDAAVAGPAVR